MKQFFSLEYVILRNGGSIFFLNKILNILKLDLTTTILQNKLNKNVYRKVYEDIIDHMAENEDI